MPRHLLLRTIFFACLLIGLCFLFTIAFALSWEGELNPTEFDKWETVKELTHSDPDEMWIIAKNPDEFSSIYFVVLIYRREYKKGKYGEVHIEAVLAEYRYWKDGEPYVFNYDRLEDKYWQIDIPDWKRKQCLQCHKQKLKSEEV